MKLTLSKLKVFMSNQPKAAAECFCCSSHCFLSVLLTLKYDSTQTFPEIKLKVSRILMTERFTARISWQFQVSAAGLDLNQHHDYWAVASF